MTPNMIAEEPTRRTANADSPCNTSGSMNFTRTRVANSDPGQRERAAQPGNSHHDDREDQREPARWESVSLGHATE